MTLLEQPTRWLLGQLRNGDLTPVDLIEEIDRALAGVPKELNPFITIDLDRAHDLALAMRDTPHLDRPLWGLPLSIKDLEPTADLPTTYGASSSLDSAPPRADGSFAERAREAGAILYAKTSTPAYGHKDVTDNLLIGATANPWDLSRTPGGSSGGAAASVAGGLGPVAHGTDAGGSVRYPAAFCGIVGFKPSFGRIPRVPTSDLWAARGHHGILSLSVDDVVVMMDALAGPDPRDPLSLPGRWRDGTTAAHPRVAFVPSVFGQEIDHAVLTVVTEAMTKLAAAGVRVESPAVDWPDPINWAQQPMAAREYHLLGEQLERTPERFEPSHVELIRRGEQVTAADLLAAQESRTQLYQSAVDLIDGYDFIVSPTMPVVAWELSETHPHINGVRTTAGPGTRWPDVLLANLLGWPAISVPCGWTDGLPVGLQITGPLHADLACLDFARTAEEILEFRRPSPPWRSGAVAR